MMCPTIFLVKFSKPEGSIPYSILRRASLHIMDLMNICLRFERVIWNKERDIHVEIIVNKQVTHRNT